MAGATPPGIDARLRGVENARSGATTLPAYLNYLSMVLTAAGLNMVGRQAVEVAAIHLFVQPLKITGEADAIE